VAFHAPRSFTLIRQIHAQAPAPRSRILDVGATSFTELLHEHSGVPLDSLGFTNQDQFPGEVKGCQLCSFRSFTAALNIKLPKTAEAAGFAHPLHLVPAEFVREPPFCLMAGATGM
jgi:hypothetical protein